MYNNKTDDTQHKTKRGNNIENKRGKKLARQIYSTKVFLCAYSACSLAYFIDMLIRIVPIIILSGT